MDFFNSNDRKKLLDGARRQGVQDILQRSNKAVCAVMEREVTVSSSEVASTITRLKNQGFMIIGTSHGNTPTKKIWFIRRGGF